jgi:class 3 adenylate cyclase
MSDSTDSDTDSMPGDFEDPPASPNGSARSSQAWLEKPDGEWVPVTGNMSFGRAETNQIVLADEKVSRRHATIHSRGEGDFWLVDLGSRNGTYLNERRIQQPTRLSDDDRVRLGGTVFMFRQPGSVASGETLAGHAEQTMTEVRANDCWLLVGDIIGSTQLTRQTPPDEMARLMGQWLQQCRQLIEAAGGTMNKYLGDGFLAFWHEEPATDEPIVKLIESLRALQKTAKPPFRFMLHRGRVVLGGAATLGEESLSGPEVNFVFRMDKLTSKLGAACLFSEAAKARLGDRVPLTALGKYSLDGFEGVFPFYTA